MSVAETVSLRTIKIFRLSHMVKHHAMKIQTWGSEDTAPWIFNFHARWKVSGLSAGRLQIGSHPVWSLNLQPFFLLTALS